MKKQDIMTPVGLILAVGLVLYGASSGSTGLGVLWDLPSVFITVGGSLAAIFITFSADDIKELSVDKIVSLILGEDAIC